VGAGAGAHAGVGVGVGTAGQRRERRRRRRRSGLGAGWGEGAGADPLATGDDDFVAVVDEGAGASCWRSGVRERGGWGLTGCPPLCPPLLLLSSLPLLLLLLPPLPPLPLTFHYPRGYTKPISRSGFAFALGKGRCWGWWSGSARGCDVAWWVLSRHLSTRSVGGGVAGVVGGGARWWWW
jgi:hypothetical protein